MVKFQNVILFISKCLQDVSIYGDGLHCFLFLSGKAGSSLDPRNCLEFSKFTSIEVKHDACSLNLSFLVVGGRHTPLGQGLEHLQMGSCSKQPQAEASFCSDF